MTKYTITFKDAGGNLGEYPWETDIEEPTLSDAQSAMNAPRLHAEIVSITPVDPPKAPAIPKKETPPPEVKEPVKVPTTHSTSSTSTSSKK